MEDLAFLLLRKSILLKLNSTLQQIGSALWKVPTFPNIQHFYSIPNISQIFPIFSTLCTPNFLSSQSDDVSEAKFSANHYYNFFAQLFIRVLKAKILFSKKQEVEKLNS